MRKPLLRRAAIGLLTLLATTSLHACASLDPQGSVTVLGPWLDAGPDSEGHAFKQVLDAFTAKTGIEVNYQETRALAQVLQSSMPSEAAPDIAILSTPGDLAKFVRSGRLYPLDGVLVEADRALYDGPWLLPTEVDGVEHIYTVPVKANLTSLVWYNPKKLAKPQLPKTMDDLLALSRTYADNGTTPWCMGMGDAPISGWPGVDLIEDIFVNRFGAEKYQQLAAGKLAWTSDEVRRAWTEWGAIATNPRFVHGGPRTALLTDFEDSGRPLFTDGAGCVFEHQASFIMGFYRDFPGQPQPGVDFDFFPFSGLAAKDPVWTVSVDLAGMFNDTPQARELLRYLATDEAQRIWPGIPGSGAFTVNKNVGTEVYGDDGISERIATVFGSGDTLCFHAVDILPATLRTAYYRAVLEYLSNPGQLDQLLENLDQIRSEIPEEEWLDLPCEES
ncbi:ABC transporter substrate-binding protein [Actinophytocola sediminis]